MLYISYDGLTLFVQLEPADKSLWIHVLETKVPCLPQTNCTTYQVKQVSSCSMPLEKPTNQNDYNILIKIQYLLYSSMKYGPKLN